MHRRLVLPDRTLRRSSTANSRGNTDRPDRSTPSPRCQHLNDASCFPTSESDKTHSDDDWYHVGYLSRHVSSTAPKSSTRRHRKHARLKASCLTCPDFQNRQPRVPVSPGSSPTIAGSFYVPPWWSDSEDSDAFSTDATSDSSNGTVALSVFEERGTAASRFSHHSNIAGFVPDMLEQFYHTFLAQRASARYIIPPDHRIRPHHQRSILLESHDATTSTTLITPVTGYFPLRCPFGFCTTPSTSIPGLIRHLQAAHREPIYCPVCGSTFPTFRSRDEHVRAQTCEYQEHLDVEGVGDRRLDKIARRDDPSMDEEGRWKKIWDGIFPGLEAPFPWVTEGTGLEVVMMRDWWRAEGRRCVEGYLDEGRVEGAVSEELVRALLVHLEDELVKRVWI